MIFAAANDAQSLGTLGVPGLVFVIFVMAAVIVYLYKDGQKKSDQALADAREYSNKITGPLESIKLMVERQAKVNEQIYDFLHDNRGK